MKKFILLAISTLLLSGQALFGMDRLRNFTAFFSLFSNKKAARSQSSILDLGTWQAEFIKPRKEDNKNTIFVLTSPPNKKLFIRKDGIIHALTFANEKQYDTFFSTFNKLIAKGFIYPENFFMDSSLSINHIIEQAVKDIVSKKPYTGTIALNIVKSQSNNSSLKFDTKTINLEKDLNERQAEAFAIILQYEIQKNPALKNNITITIGSTKAPDKFNTFLITEALADADRKINLYFYQNGRHPVIKIYGGKNHAPIARDLNVMDAKTIENILSNALNKNSTLNKRIEIIKE